MVAVGAGVQAIGETVPVLVAVAAGVEAVVVLALTLEGGIAEVVS